MDACVVMDGLGNGNNVGSIMRTAEAFGFSEVCVVCNEAARGKNHSRTSRGAHALLDVRFFDDPGSLLRDLRARGRRIVLVTEKSHVNFDDDSVAYEARDALVFGNEGVGPSDELRKSADLCVGIPMCGLADSLNVGVAAGIVLHHVRKALGPPPPRKEERVRSALLAKRKAGIRDMARK